MPKTEKRGSGITSRSVDVWGGDLGEADLARFFETRPQPTHADLFDEDIAELERWAAEKVDHAPKSEKTGLPIIDRHDDSPESYALRVTEAIGIVRDCIKRRDATNAARFAVQLGGLATEARMKFAWERPALQGVRRRADTSKGAGETNKKKRELASEWQDRIRARVERLVKAGKTDQDIAGKTYIEACRSMESVRKFVADVRAEVRAKK